MTPSSSPRLVHLPVRMLETLDASGERSHSVSVPCPMRGGSVDLDACRLCPRLAGIDFDAQSPSGVVHCSSTAPRNPDHVGGCALAHDVPSVREDVSLQELTSFFVQQGLARVAVVDEDGRLTGVITERDLVVGDILEIRHLTEVPAETLVRHTYSVTEATSLREALRTMARHQLREIPVVSDAGQFTGWLEDIQALRALRKEAAR